MRLMAIGKVTSDMILARTLYHNDGRILLNKGYGNLNKFKNKLEEYGIHYIYIEDEKSHGIELNEAISEQTRLSSKKIIAEATRNIAVNKSINIESVRNAVSNIIEDILANKNVLLNLTDIKSNDDYTFAHSVNVTVISILIGKFLNFSYNELLNLGTGSLMHDIGKAVLPDEILNKPGKLTDEEYKIIQEHPQLGFDMVKDSIDINPLSRVAILTHHEKCDGTGYPGKLKGKNIHKHGRIVAVADVFDALTSDRVYRKKWPVYQAVEYLESLAGIHFDYDIVNLFVDSVSPFPNGSTVRLSTGEKAIVKQQNHGFSTRPVVRVIQDGKGNNIIKEINLEHEPSIVILEIE